MNILNTQKEFKVYVKESLPFGQSYSYTVNVWANNEEHAMKIVEQKLSSRYMETEVAFDNYTTILKAENVT